MNAASDMMAQAAGMMAPWVVRLTGHAPASAVRIEQGGMSLPARTIGLDSLFGGRCLVLLDGENISYGLREAGFDCNYATMLRLLSARAEQIEAHAFVSTLHVRARRYAEHYFAEAGWRPHVTIVPAVPRRNGQARRANSDNDILLAAGGLLAGTSPDVVVIASGDGDLGTAIARHCRAIPRSPRVIVCSIDGSTSGRLEASRNADIAGNVRLGWDCIEAVNVNQENDHEQQA
jgi:hypothetical protein